MGVHQNSAREKSTCGVSLQAAKSRAGGQHSGRAAALQRAVERQLPRLHLPQAATHHPGPLAGRAGPQEVINGPPTAASIA